MANIPPVFSLSTEGTDGVEPDAQVKRLLGSAALRHSPVLQSFLQFITTRALSGREAEISEYTIAIEVFGRGSNFDPSGDTIVRTQAYRLRSKLESHYATEGVNDPIVIEIPKGHYVPVFRINDRRENRPLPASVAEVDRFLPQSVSWTRAAIAITAALLTVVIGLAFAVGWRGGRTGAGAKPSQAPSAISPVVEAFWRSFLGSDEQPVVAFTNGQFLATPNGDLLRFKGGAVADRGALISSPGKRTAVGNPVSFEDDITGVGEVLAAVAISKALIPITSLSPFKRSRLVSALDLQHHNVIFLGSPGVNPILNEVPQPQNFVYRPAKKPPYLWQSEFANLRPRAGESPSYPLERDQTSGVLRADYATVTVLPGVAPGRRILVLAGLTTSGTQAAAECVTSLHGLLEMARWLGVQEPANAKGWPATFEVLLRAELSRGLDVIQSRVIAVRVIARASQMPQ